jgi:Mrp family chromosome partitioning ATPase
VGDVARSGKIVKPSSFASLERTLERTIERLGSAPSTPQVRALLIEARRLRSVIANWRSIPPPGDVHDEMVDRVLQLSATLGDDKDEAARPAAKAAPNPGAPSPRAPQPAARGGIAPRPASTAPQPAVDPRGAVIEVNEAAGPGEDQAYSLDFEPHLYSLESETSARKVRGIPPQPLPREGLGSESGAEIDDGRRKLSIPRPSLAGPLDLSAAPRPSPPAASPAPRPQPLTAPAAERPSPTPGRIGAADRLGSASAGAEVRPSPVDAPERGRAAAFTAWPMPDSSPGLQLGAEPAPAPPPLPVVEAPAPPPAARIKSIPPPAPPEAVYLEDELSVPRTPIKAHAVKLAEPVNPLLVTLLDAYSPSTDAYRALRRKLVAGGDPRVIGITSANPREGKTVLTLNFALALRESARGRVLVVEANLRSPIMAKMLGFDPPECFIEQLRSRLDDPRRPWIAAEPMPKLHVMAIDTRQKHEPLLDPVAFASGMDRLKQAGYDYILVDSPPVLGGMDVNVIADAMDGMIFAALPMISKRRQMRKAVEQLEPAPILGVVVLET